MTTLQLGQKLLFFLEGVETLGDLPIKEKSRLVDAINFGLGEFLAALPDDRLSHKQSWKLRAPIVQPINIVAGATGFSYQTGTPYPAGGYITENEAIGHSCVVEGDPQLNRLANNGTLLSPFNGTTGNQNLTLYGDAANLGQNDQRFLSEIHLVDTSGSLKLLRWIDPNVGLFLSHPVSFGEPVYYYLTSHRGHATAETPLWHLRVWPLPVLEYSVQADIRSFPDSLTFDDLFVSRSLPLTVAEESLLIALIAPGLRFSKMLAPHIKADDLMAEAGRARTQIRTMHQPRLGEVRTLRTKEGF
jgi:hypothetical protein